MISARSVPLMQRDTDCDSESESCFSHRVQVLIYTFFFYWVAFIDIFISLLSDRLTRCQLGGRPLSVSMAVLSPAAVS